MKIFKNKRKNHEEEGYWQSSTDLMVGLLLVIMLLLALLLLLLARKNDYKYEYDGTQVYSTTTHLYDYDDYETTTDDWDDDEEETTTRVYNEGGGGGGQVEPQTTGRDRMQDEIGKTAVLVAVIDQETGKVIKKSGIEFELYADQDTITGLQSLYTYYPDKIEYKKFVTTEDGTFYLPEKIWDGWYSLHNMTAPPEYVEGSVAKFEITEARDWNDPYLVSVPLIPAKNTIKINAIDSESKAPVPGSVFEIVAEENIILLDGSVRLHKGDVADTVTCDENGYAASKALYVGKYRIRQKEANQFYALNTDTIVTEVQIADEVETPVIDIPCEKTAYIFTLKDAADASPIRGATFTLGDDTEVLTDDTGRITMTDLVKGADYSLTLKTLPAPYRDKALTASFTVDAKGYIRDQAKYYDEGTAYTIRLSASACDRLLKQEVEGINLTLYDSEDQVVQNWDSNGNERILDGLEPGKYSLEIAGRKSSRITVDVKDTEKVQKGVIYLWTLLDFVLIIAGAAVLAAAALIGVHLIRKKKGKSNGEG
ncbi:MAG: hypothetical protein IK080_04330 [Clostridia bacterium]|nr:hypothetical protein [Clostridia bacterium]